MGRGEGEGEEEGGAESRVLGRCLPLLGRWEWRRGLVWGKVKGGD